MNRIARNMTTVWIVLAALIALAVVVVWYDRIVTISFVVYRPRISQSYCALSKTPNTPEYPVILVPGLKGSLLEDEEGLAWLRVRDLFITGSTPSRVQYPENTLTPTGVLTRLVGIPLFAEYKSYHRATADLACAPHGYTFYYDWRKAPQDIIPELDRLVDRVRQETGKKPAIVAHSYGGVITRGYMQTHHQKLGALVYVSTPFNPGPDFLIHDLTEGVPVLLNKSITPAEVVVSHESSYYLIPHYGNTSYRGKEVMDAATWKEDGLGPYAYDPNYSQDRLQTMLDRAREWQRLMDAPFEGDNPIMIVHNTAIRTLKSVLVSGDEEYAGGDGRVDSDSAQPIGITGSQLTIMEHPASHGRQLQSRELVEGIWAFINEHAK